MPLEFLNLGGHAHFGLYDAYFRQHYVAVSITDMRGKTILFGSAGLNRDQDCAHVCYGGDGMWTRSAQDWRESRASRIPWIIKALTDPKYTTVHVSKDAAHPRGDARVYLYYTTDEADPAAPYQFFVVIAIVKDEQHLQFLTAYDVTQEQFRRWKENYPKEWPLPPPKKPGRAKGKKK